jgi:fibronectin-binding autotransporter adhesin
MEEVAPWSYKNGAPRSHRGWRHVLHLLVFTSLAGSLTHGEVFYWDADPGAGIGGTGAWNTTSSLWRPGSPSVSQTFWPGSGANNDAALQGTAGTLTLGSTIQVNDLNVAPTTNTIFTVAGASQILSLVGSAPSTVEVASGATLSITSRLIGTSGLVKTAPGRLIIDNFANNLTGPILVEGGILQLGSTTNNASSAALRSSPVHLGAGTTLSIDGGGATYRTGSLTGSGTITGVGKTLYISNFGSADPSIAPSTGTYFAPGPVHSGVVNTSSLNISGAGGSQVILPSGAFSMMTLDGDLREIRASITVNSGAGLTLTGTGAVGKGTASNSTAVNVRGGALVLDSFSGNPSGGVGRVGTGTGTSMNLQGGTLVLVGSSSTSSSANISTTRLGSGASTILVVQTGQSAAVMNLGGIDRVSTLRSTIDFRAEGGTLGATGGNPRITVGTLTGFQQEPWMTVNGTDYASHDSTNGIKPAVLTPFPSLPTGAGSTTTYYDLTGNGSLDSQNFSARGIRILPTADGGSLNLGGTGNLATTGVLLAGSRDYSITATGSGGLTSSAPRYIGVSEAQTTLTISAPFRSPGQDIVKYGRGVLEITADHSATLNTGTTAFVVNSGTLRATVGANGSLPSTGATSLLLRGGILEIANGSDGTGTGADFQYTVGFSGAGRVNWSGFSSSSDEGSGGFAAIRQNATVNLGGLANPSSLQWDTSYFIRNGNALLLSSETADRRITLLNGIGLDNGGATNDYFAREFRVADNPLSSTDSARISGVITGGPNADFLKTGRGTLELTGTNTFTGNTIIQQGVLQLGASGGPNPGAIGALAGTAKIILKSNITNVDGELVANDRGTLLLSGDPAVADRIGDGTALVMEGGVFDANGRSETLGTLTLLHVDSILDLGHVAEGSPDQVLRFAPSNELAWTGKLEIWNWSGNEDGGGTDQLHFGIGGLREDQLANISFYSDNGATFLGSGSINALGEVLPAVPEPGTALSAAILIGYLAGTRQWRFRRRNRGDSLQRLPNG